MITYFLKGESCHGVKVLTPRFFNGGNIFATATFSKDTKGQPAENNKPPRKG